MFKKLGKAILLLMLVGGSLSATSKYSNSCSGCHGISGEKAALGKSKIIKNMSAKEIKNALTGYKNGTYGASMKAIMKGQAKSLSANDIVEIANYIGKGGQLSLKYSNQSKPLTLSREDEKCVNLVNTVPENFWRQIVKKQECPKNRSYYKNISQQKKREYKKAIAVNKSIEVQKIIDSQGEYKNLSRKEALELFQKNTGISLYHKKISSNKVVEFCKKKGLSIPSFLNISEAKESFIKYKYYSSILELKKKGKKISKDNLRYVTGDISMIVVNDKKNMFAYMKEFELNKEVGSYGISVIACKKSTKEDKLLAKKAKELEKQENQEKARLIKKYKVSTPIEYWQYLVKAKDSKELANIQKYNPQHDFKIGGKSVWFINDKTIGGLSTGIDKCYYDKYSISLSENIFSWAIKANASQRSSFSKGYGHSQGLTHNGYTMLLSELKKQPLFMALSNVKLKSNDYANLISAEFLDKKERKHHVYIVLKATQFYVFLDNYPPSWIY